MQKSELQGFTCYNLRTEIEYSSLSSTFKCLILETDARPDYYAKRHFPPSKKGSDFHLFLPIKNSVNCFQDIIFRNIYSLNEDKNIDLHITPGQIVFQNENHQCLRVRGTETEHLAMIIDKMKSLGIKFMKNIKVKSYTGTVFYKKYTEFIKLDSGIYQDKFNKFRYFFAIPNHIDIDEFLKGAIKIKNNCNFHMFDSFLSYIFIKNKVQDFIGIYSEHCDKARFGELKDQIQKIYYK